MKATFFALAGFVAAAVAVPGYAGGSYVPCPSGLFANPQCCATDVLGLANLNCGSPSKVPTSASTFKSICATGGQRARCCAIPVAGQALLCQTPVGLGEQ
ncbi:hydrophobin-like protein [Poronia punctata]|nr:hydrophobin-like protein [Poronia punctata]